MLFLVLLILLVMTYLIYDWSKRYDMIKYGAKIPGPFALPFIGNLFLLANVKDNKDLFYKLREVAAKYSEEGMVRVWLGQTLVVLVYEPSLIEIVANLPEASKKGSIYKQAVGHTFNGAVVASGGPRWKELRKPITISMKAHHLENNYFEVFIRRSNDFINFVKQNREGEIFDCISDITALFMDYFVETHCGVPQNEVWERKWNYAEKTERIVKLSMLSTMKYGLNYWPYVVKLSKKSPGFEKDKRDSFAFYKWLLGERERIISSSPENKGACEYYTDFLLRRRKENNLSEKQICHEFADLVEAGVDTSALIASSMLLFIAMHPEIQERAYQEQLNIFGDSERDATIDDIRSMKYLEMIFKETSRYVAAPGSFRSPTADIKIGKYVIPKGTVIFAYFKSLRTDPKYWERPKEFYPEHFLPEAEAARHKYALIPYGFGVRMCAGKTYGFISLMVALSTILRNYKITTPLKFQDLRYEISLFCFIHQRYKIKLEKRNKTPSCAD